MNVCLISIWIFFLFVWIFISYLYECFFREGTENCCLSFRYFIAQEQTGTIRKLHSCGKCPNSQILKNSFLEKRNRTGHSGRGRKYVSHDDNNPPKETLHSNRLQEKIEVKHSLSWKGDNLMFRVYLELPSNYNFFVTTRKLWNDFGVLDSIHCSLVCTEVVSNF